MDIKTSISVKDSVKKALELNPEYNLFVTILNNEKTENEKGILANIPYAVKDNIVTKDILTTASSNTLNNYVPIFNATVIDKLNKSGAVKIGKTVLDELGMGGTGLTGHTGIVRNPLDKTRIVGGSSAGSAGAVAANIVSFSLGSDTGDSIRKPASYVGIVGYKPTYGLISRYGLIPFASSLDHIGVLTNTVYDAAYVTNIIKGKDEMDMTSIDSSNIDLVEDINSEVKNKKLFYIEELCNIDYYQEQTEELKLVLNNFKELLKKLEKQNYEIKSVSVDQNILNSLKPAYDSISSSEATSNNSNLTGILFGPRDESTNYLDMIINHRTKGFCHLIKRRFVIGSYVLQKENKEKYYLNACRVRKLITDIMTNYFNEYGTLIMPAAPSVAPKIEDVTDNIQVSSAIENHLVIGNFGGFPSITIPAFQVNNLPVGINLTSSYLSDKYLLNLATKIEEIIDWRNL